MAVPRSSAILVAAAMALGALLGSGITSYLSQPAVSQPDLPQANMQATAQAEQQTAVQANDLTAIYNQVENSVVQITARVSSVNSNIIINGMPLESQSTVLGSGFVYDTEGHIVTNNHVVDGASEVEVTFTDGNTYSAEVLGRDAYSDLAVLEITDRMAETLEPLKMADSSKVAIGEPVIAIGNPFGLSNTMTAGIISQLGRLLPNESSGFSIPNVIQTDAAINPGNSGGPLLNTKGEVVGVNTAIRSSTGDFAGVGFAIPSNTVNRIVPVLAKEGSYDHPWLGISGASINPDLARELGLEKNYKGILVNTVMQGGPADKAGIRGTTVDRAGNISEKGDIITAIDGHSAKRMENLITYLEEQKAVGDSVTLSVDRAGHEITIKAVLEARPGLN
ncbi:trypsin-like peptidase domain-containing protein [Nitrososphaera sp.]|uniref:S1C family serine protease n=1 Tax=Nitrososphaera sp. TaxID=1971748 RepID=UPI0025F4BE37|nr:trypsin-like peptidase domain-containing protein [Nitrososphaera sp.]